MLGDVTDQGKTVDDPTVRGNELGGIALDYHTDGSDLVGLLCLRSARTGGLSCVANAVAIHNHLVRESPELAAALYEPLPYDTRGEQAEGAQAFYSIPAFTEHAGRLFVRFIPQYILASQRHPDAPRLSSTAREAIAAASALANDPDFNVYMDLQPGEMQFINNYHVLHGRTAYEDDVAHGYKRHLKRLWLATYALTDRPKLVRRPRRAATGRPSARSAPCRRWSGSTPLSPPAARPREPTPPRAHGHGGVDEVARQGTLAQDAHGRHGGVDDGRRLALADAAVDDAGDVGRIEACATSPASVWRSGTVRHGPCSLQSLRRARPSGMPTVTAQGLGGPRSPRRPAPRPPASGRNTSTGPGQQRSSNRCSSSVQAVVSAADVVQVADRVVRTFRIGRQRGEAGLAVGRLGAHGEAVATDSRHRDHGSPVEGAHHLGRAGAHDGEASPPVVPHDHSLPTSPTGSAPTGPRHQRPRPAGQVRQDRPSPQ